MMKMKKVLCILLAVCLLVSVLPTASLAVDTTTLHNCNVPEGYHLFTDLPTAENPVTTETLYWGNAFDGVFYGMTGSGFSSGAIATSTDVAAQNTITIQYGGVDETYGTYYYLVYTLPDSTAYTFAYSGGYFSQNKLTDGLPSGGWAAKHKLFYDAEEHLFYHRPSADMTVMKALKISASSFKFFTDTVAKVLADGTYPVRVYTVCTSDNVAGENDTHQWSGSCKYEGCETKFDYQTKEPEVVEIEVNDPAGYHQFTGLPTAENTEITDLYLGAAFEDNGPFYGIAGLYTAATSTDKDAHCTVTVTYGGNDADYGDYYYIKLQIPGGKAWAITYGSGVFTQNSIQTSGSYTGQPSDGWQYKHRLYFHEEGQFFYHRPSADKTVMKGIEIDPSTYMLGTAEVADLIQEGYYPVRLFEACTSDNVADQDTTHHWSGTCTCGDKFDYEPNYVVETRAPQENTPYFWGVTQLDAEGDPTYFFAGEDLGTTFNTQADMLTSTPVYVAEADGGYNLYFLDGETAKYICLGKDAANSYKTYIDFTEAAADATVFTWNTTYNTFVTTVVKDAEGGTVDMVLGAYTSGSTAYTKLSALLLTHLAQDHYFASHLYVQHMTHTYDGWGYDEQYHWEECFCGKEKAAEEHELGELEVEDGKVVRKCACGYTAQEGTVPTIDGYSISLKDNFAINFFVKQSYFDGGYYTDPYMVFTMKGQETTVTEYTTRDDYYVFTFDNLAPDLMQETVTAELYATVAEEVACVDTGEYSVAQYGYTALRNEGSGDALRKLLVETLNFGAASEQFRNSSVADEDLVNADLTEEERALGDTGDLRELTSCRDFGTYDASNPVQWYGATLAMGDSIKLRVYFTTAEDIADLSVEAVGETIGAYTLTKFGTNRGMYYVDFAELNPTQMSEEITFTVYKGETAVSTTMHYSIESYAKAWLDNTNVTDEQKGLVEAVIRYGDAAKDYVQRAFDLQEDVCYMGRTYALDGTQWFNWSASGFSVQFQGSGLQAKIASKTNATPAATNYAYLKVYVDGVEQEDILLDETMQTVILAENLDPDETHTVEVRKRNSPRSSTAGLTSLEVLDGVKLDAPAAKSKLIEFVGDSLTVGYSAADVNKTATAWSTATEDGTKTYSKQVADAFGAEYMVTAISGRGVVMNNGGASGYLLPDIYPELDIYNIPGTAYDFALQPDVIVINLGTNDATNSGLDIDAFQAGVVSFINLVRAKNPNAQIIWAYGLRSDNRTEDVDAAIQAAVAQVNADGDSNVHYLALALAADMHLNHPTAAAYAPSGEKLIEKIEEITGW